MGETGQKKLALCIQPKLNRNKKFVDFRPVPGILLFLPAPAALFRLFLLLSLFFIGHCFHTGTFKFSSGVQVEENVQIL